MPKVGMQEIRYHQLIEATYDCIEEYGLYDTTIQKISQSAGVSTGIISHYFGGKSELLEASMRELIRKLHPSIASCKTPKEKITAIINNNFTNQQLSDRSATTWLAFWSQSMHEPRLARLQKINRRRLASNLCYWLQELMSRSQAIQISEGLVALIDGLWLAIALKCSNINAEKASVIVHEFLNAQLSSLGKHSSGDCN